MERLVKNFIEEQNWNYDTLDQEDGSTVYRLGLNVNETDYHMVLICDFAEKYFEVVAVHPKPLPKKSKKSIMNVFNIITQRSGPLLHIFTENGMLASKYTYIQINEEPLTSKRIDHMISTVLSDIAKLYPELKKIAKKSKKKAA